MRECELLKGNEVEVWKVFLKFKIIVQNIEWNQKRKRKRKIKIKMKKTIGVQDSKKGGAGSS